MNLFVNICQEEEMMHVGDELEKTQEAIKCGLCDTTARSAIGKRMKMQMSLP